MYTMQQVAEIFGVHYRTITRWVKDGTIKPMKIGGIIRIPEEEIERLKKINDDATKRE